MTEQQHLPAGDFSSWLARARQALLGDIGTDVACRDCIGCCSSSYFIHIKPEETKVFEQMQKTVLVAAPGQPKGHKLMGYDRNGYCPMLADGKCSIYEYRPQTCRNYDCRVFAASGIAAGGADKATINKRVSQWRFSYPTTRDRDEHEAVKAAAKFIQECASNFPGGRVPDNPSQLAVLALKVYEVFLNKGNSTSSESEIASAIIEASRKFDAQLENTNSRASCK